MASSACRWGDLVSGAGAVAIPDALISVRAGTATWADTAGPPLARTIPSKTPALSEVNDRTSAEDRVNINETPGQGRKSGTGAFNRSANVSDSSTLDFTPLSAVNHPD